MSTHSHALSYQLASLAIAGAVVAVSASALRQSRRRSSVTARLEAVRIGQSAANTSAPEHGGRLVGWIGRFGRALAGSGILPAHTLAELRASLSTAGLPGTSGLGIFIGFKFLLLLALGSAGWLASRQFTGMSSIALPLGGAVFGMLLPDLYLKRHRRQYLKRVEAGLPDALDMMVICSEAGLSLEPSIERVAAEIATAHTAIAAELQATVAELRIIPDRRRVLLNLGDRTGLENLRRLGATLIQTTQFGTPLTQALRILATEMRQEALTRFEARAARLPVFLTVPMIVFILPCIFIIVGGPAALQLTAVFGKK